MDIILESVRVACNLDAECTDFDDELIPYTNLMLLGVTQMGVGPASGFSIKDADAEWSEFIDEEDPRSEAVKTYVGLKVRMLFDPPTNTTFAQALEKGIAEAEWRITSAFDYPVSEVTE